MSACLWLVDATGIPVGGSSGALVAAALRLLRCGDRDGADVVAVCPDGGDRYLTTVYSESWRRSNLPAQPSVLRVTVLGVREEDRAGIGAR